MIKELPKSVLTKNQTRDVKRKIGNTTYILHLRHDDCCGTGHNSFGITIDAYEGREWVRGGAAHDLIKEVFPEYSKYIKWHLCSSDSPLHYITNTRYFAKESDLEAARESAIWEDATLEELSSKEKLIKRLPALMEEFKEAMEELGFVY